MFEGRTVCKCSQFCPILLHFDPLASCFTKYPIQITQLFPNNSMSLCKSHLKALTISRSRGQRVAAANHLNRNKGFCRPTTIPQIHFGYEQGPSPDLQPRATPLSPWAVVVTKQSGWRQGYDDEPLINAVISFANCPSKESRNDEKILLTCEWPPHNSYPLFSKTNHAASFHFMPPILNWISPIPVNQMHVLPISKLVCLMPWRVSCIWKHS